MFQNIPHNFLQPPCEFIITVSRTNPLQEPDEKCEFLNSVGAREVAGLLWGMMFLEELDADYACAGDTVKGNLDHGLVMYYTLCNSHSQSN
jgi:hypothetical protein